ncbi:MAG: hypothetical protein QXP76_01400, partial [Acidilobaceae archaeon]
GRGVYSKSVVVKALRSLGFSFTEEELIELGKKIYLEKHRLKIEEGFEPEAVRISRRILETPTPLGHVSEEYIREGVKEYKKLVTSGF